MAGPIYRLFLGKPTEAWYQLSEDERRSLFGKLTAALAEVGGKEVITCTSSWSTEQWPFFGIEEFPDVEALQKLAARHEEINWYRYVESMTVVGTKMTPS